MKPTEICEILSLSPDQVIHEGEVVSGTKIRSKAHKVKIFHQVVEENSYVHFANNLRLFVERLEPHGDELIRLSERCKLWINCVDYTTDGFPALFFENDLLGTMARLKLNLDIDLYH